MASRGSFVLQLAPAQINEDEEGQTRQRNSAVSPLTRLYVLDRMPVVVGVGEALGDVCSQSHFPA